MQDKPCTNHHYEDDCYAKQSQLIETPKTMLDWFAENGIKHISVDVSDEEQRHKDCDIMAVYAAIEYDQATGRGSHRYSA